MRICFITQWFDPEPSPISGLGLVRYLRDQGHEVHVITTFPNYPGGRIYPGYHNRPRTIEEFEPGITITRTAVLPSHDTSALKRLVTYLSFAATAATLGLPRGRTFDVIYAYQGQATIGIPALVAKRRYRAPVVLHVQDFWPDTVTKSGFLPSKLEPYIDAPLRLLCRGLYSRMDRTIGLSPGMTALLLANRADASGASTVYNWAEEELFLPEVWQAAPDDGVVSVLYGGNIGPFQRLDIAVKAAVLAAKRAPSLRLDIVGGGPDEPNIRALIDQLGAKNVTLLGFQPYETMPQMNHEADALLVCLDDHEFFNGIVPSKVQVGLAAGRPMIGALAGDARELLDRSGGAVTCVPGNVEALADAFVTIVEAGAEGRSLLGRNGRSFYQSELSFAAGAAAIEQTLLAAARGRVGSVESGAAERA